MLVLMSQTVTKRWRVLRLQNLVIIPATESSAECVFKVTTEKRVKIVNRKTGFVLFALVYVVALAVFAKIT
jgi:hypothetical protein